MFTTTAGIPWGSRGRPYGSENRPIWGASVKKNNITNTDFFNMAGNMLANSMRVSGMDQDGDGVRQAMSGPMYKTREEADAAIAIKNAEYKAKREAAMNTPEAKKSIADWYASMTPENRRIYQLMSRY
jgi:hypothetical protein